MSQFQQEFIAKAIEHYGLELDGESIDAAISAWLHQYDRVWVAKAVIESVYRGRYKVKSVDNILKDWQRRGSPFCKYPPDYERGILNSLPLQATLLASPVGDLMPRNSAIAGIQIDLDRQESVPSQYHTRSDNSPESADKQAEIVNAALMHRATNEAPDLYREPQDRAIPRQQSHLDPTDVNRPKKSKREHRAALAPTSHLVEILHAIVDLQQAAPNVCPSQPLWEESLETDRPQAQNFKSVAQLSRS